MIRFDSFLIISVVLLLAFPCIATATEWQIETVDSEGSVGNYTSVALDSNGYPHISYRDMVNEKLKYAYWDGVDWQIWTVDSRGDVGRYTSLVLDSNGYPHISYCDDTNDDLMYAFWDGTGWQIQIVDSEGRVGYYTSLALDSNGYPCISYWDETNHYLKYAYWNGISWQIQTVESIHTTYTSLALDSSGYPHIGYLDRDRWHLKYAYWDGISWQIQTVDSTGRVGIGSSLSLDSSDFPHISYCENGGYLKYAYWDGVTWRIETMDILVSLYTSLALDSNDYPHISFFRSREYDLMYAYWDGADWQIETVDSEGDVGRYTSLALDSNDYPHISYYDETNGDLKYATLSPSDTTPPTPNTIASIAAVSSTQIDITSTEAQDDTPPVFYRLDGQYYDGASWVDSGGGVSDYDYSTTRPNPWSDASLVENGWYRYRQKVKDSANPPNESAWSDWVEKATLLNPPQDAEITFANVTETGMDVTVATPPKPSGTGATGAYFDIITGEGQGSGAIDRGYADDYTAEYANLNLNTQYGWKVKYKNRDGVETAYNPTEQKRYTLANTPSAPTVSNPTPTTLDVTINPNGNPDYTLFAIYNVTGSYYVNATGGSNGDTEVWQTESDWGTVTVVELTPETTYEFKCKAKNGDLIETSFGASGYGTTTAHPDTTPPAAVIDLATSNPTDTQIKLTWTAPGDDGSVGAASQYDIRYSTSPIDDDNFSSATQCQGEPTPQAAGSTETYTVTGLSPSTTYYFAMKTADEAPNWSDLSNVVQETTMASPPIIDSLSPTSGVVGTQVTISGGNFGEEQGDSTVTFNGVDAGVADSWVDTEIKVKAPVGATTGPVVVTVNGQASNNDKIFTVIQPPIISSINPTSGPIGTQVTITGNNFGDEQGASTVTFFDGVDAGVADSWTDTEIKIKAPQGASTGAVFVTVNGVESNKDKIFTVTAGVTVKLEPDEKKIPLSATADIDIMVKNAPGVSGFEFRILYDSDVVSIKSITDVQLGPFLGSTGRTVFPVGPDIREDLEPAEVTFGAASLLGPNPLPTGDGILASIVFTAVSVGTTNLDLTNVKLLDADAEKIPVSEEDGVITVEQILYGDVSGNDEITAYDVSLVLQHIVGLIELPPDAREAADVTDDGTISALDAALILQYTVGLITSFPVDNPPIAPALNPKTEIKLLTETIEQLETIYLTREQKQVLEQLKNLVFSQLIPRHNALLQNFPNPFNPETWIPYQLAKPAEVTIRIYNLKGQLIRTLLLGGQPSGSYLTRDQAAYWNGKDNIGQKVSSGLYFYTITADKFAAIKRMILLK